MDPLSLTASVIAVAGLATQVGKTLRAFYNGTNELFAVQNEITDLEALLQSYAESQDDEWRPEQRGLAERAAVTLANIKSKLDELGALLSRTPKWPFAKVKGVAWVRNEKAISRLRTELRTSKQALLETMHLLTAGSSQRAVYQIDQLRISVGHMQDSVVTSHTAMLDGLSGIHQVISSDDSKSLSTSEGLPAYAFSMGTNSENATVGLACSVRRSSSGCVPLCSCRCHSHGRLSSPRVLDQVVGQLLVGYSMRPRTPTTCNEKACTGNERSTFRLLYVFPTWFLSWCVSLLITQSTDRPPELLLRIPRMRPHTDLLWEQISLGDIDFVKSAFANKTAHIDDVTDIGAQGLLHATLFQKRTDMIAFLIDQGADIHVTDRKHHSPGDIFGLITFSRGMPESDCTALASRFEDSTFVEKAQFPLLHKIVFGQVKADLEQVLAASTADIDGTDAYGRTALAWCGSRGDYKLGDILLRYGADPNIVEKGGWGPLHNVLLTDSTALSRRLLEAGADPNKPTTFFKDTPLYEAIDNYGSNSHIPALLEFGADTTQPSGTHESPLHFAAERSAEAVEMILPKTPWRYHTRAVVAAIRLDREQTLATLIRLGAECSGVDEEGRSVLHYLAIFGSLSALTLLQPVLSGIPPDLVDSKGHTASDWAGVRTAGGAEWMFDTITPPALDEKWHELWAETINSARRAEEALDREEFMDAEEYNDDEVSV